jgi:Domain of unknown function (DUF1772)
VIFSQILVMTALLSAGVVYGTDAFFAVVGRSALAQTSEAALTEVMGRIHEVADVRMPVFGVVGLASTLGLIFTTGLGSLSSVFAGAALAELGTQLGAYLTVAQPVNRALTEAARQGITPPDARALQRRWDSVIILRAVGTGVAIAGLTLCALSLGSAHTV